MTAHRDDDPTMAEPMRIEGRAVVLRDFTIDDLDETMTIVGDERVTRWLSFDVMTRARQEDALLGVLARAQMVPRSEYYLAVTERDSNVFAGFARLGLNGVRAAKLGYAIRYDLHGRGLATDAARSLVGFGFTALKLHRISSAIGPDNLASIRVAEKLGMVHEGRIRDHVFTNGAWRDSKLYAILEHEWPRGVDVPSR
ncbi:GNAT family N-acetyltransferase [Saccharothrix deserti]|uniref:GNAT family N-acetyltransferase n=1 Tax=Saccharothrix deserti TaxID=2593674 RepID=UPI00131AEE6F|nr:GNAT family protein [Saccharothrix deserti]